MFVDDTKLESNEDEDDDEDELLLPLDEEDEPELSPLVLELPELPEE